MAQSTVTRRRPCRNCGGRYFVRTIHIVYAVIAIAIAVGGFAKAILGSGVMSAMHANASDPSSVSAVTAGGHGMSSVVWAFGAIVGAAIVAVLGRGYRCINCDTQQ